MEIFWSGCISRDGKVLKNLCTYLKVDFFQHYGTFVALDLANSEGNFYVPSFLSDYFENIEDRIDKHKDWRRCS